MPNIVVTAADLVSHSTTLDAQQRPDIKACNMYQALMYASYQPNTFLVFFPVFGYAVP